MTISKLRTISETTISGTPDLTLERFIKDAIKEHDELKELFRTLMYSTVVCDGVLLAKPDVYNKIVELFNKSN